MTPIEPPQARHARGSSTRKPTIGNDAGGAPNKSAWRMSGHEIFRKAVVKVRVRFRL
jgi:hypothetical protein